MGELRELPSIDPAEDVVGAAERLLEKARSGELSSFVAALVYKDGCVGWVRSEIPTYPTQIGSLVRAAYRLNRELDE